jgi:hypothetical protein
MIQDKPQEAGLWLCSIVDGMALSKEQVEQYNKLFLVAVKWYGAEEI